MGIDLMLVQKQGIREVGAPQAHGLRQMWLEVDRVEVEQRELDGGVFSEKTVESGQGYAVGSGEREELIRDRARMAIGLPDILGVTDELCHIKKLEKPDVTEGTPGRGEVNITSLAIRQMFLMIANLRLLRKGFQMDDVVLPAIVSEGHIVRNPGGKLA